MRAPRASRVPGLVTQVNPLDRAARQRGMDAMSNPDGPIDPEALGNEREEYPDPESYPPPELPADERPAPETTDGSVPDPDIAAGDPDGQT